MTADTCPEAGTWLGKGRIRLFGHIFVFITPILDEDVTIIDTPGFGDDIEEDERTVNELVDTLKNDVKFINAFVIVFNGQNPRFTYRYGTTYLSSNNSKLSCRKSSEHGDLV